MFGSGWFFDDVCRENAQFNYTEGHILRGGLYEWDSYAQRSKVTSSVQGKSFKVSYYERQAGFLQFYAFINLGASHYPSQTIRMLPFYGSADVKTYLN